MPDFSLELNHIAAGATLVAGVDEAGRGAWAGPLFVAMVIFSPEIILSHDDLLRGIDDSKKLTPAARERVFEEVTRLALHWSFASIDCVTIDKVGLTAATRLGIEHCVKSCEKRINMLLLDGKCTFGIPYPCECHPRADSASYSVAAASIIAKVLRDREMRALAGEYPAYHFDLHKGYGTALHRESLEAHGICPIHRKSYKPVQQFLASAT